MPAENGGKRLQSKFLTIGKFLLLIGILMVVGLLSAFVGMRIAVRGTEVEVPGILGRPAEEAKAILAKAALKLAISGRRYDAQVPEGAVISQHPAPGGRIKVNREVQVILSLGERRNPVPRLRGASLRAAQSMILQSGYELGNVSEVTLRGAPKDEVIEQFPAPDRREIVNPRIDILVNRETVVGYVMPDVTGQDLNQVVSLFEKHGLKVGRIQYRPYPNVSKATVIKQFPEPGYLLTSKDSINLEVAR